jgi:hypothetical protein
LFLFPLWVDDQRDQTSICGIRHLPIRPESTIAED